MDAYAVFETGGKQYRVAAGDTVTIERLTAEVGATVEFDRVLAKSDGATLTVGAPMIEGTAISGTVVDHNRGDKVINFKKKRRKGYSRKVGHRQEQTVIKVDSL
jgi:large subunit ribosomal protein L21